MIHSACRAQADIMARSLSMDLRERVVRAVDEGPSRREAAVRFGVSAANAVRWCALARERGKALSAQTYLGGLRPCSPPIGGSSHRPN